MDPGPRRRRIRARGIRPALLSPQIQGWTQTFAIRRSRAKNSAAHTRVRCDFRLAQIHLARSSGRRELRGVQERGAAPIVAFDFRCVRGRVGALAKRATVHLREARCGSLDKSRILLPRRGLAKGRAEQERQTRDSRLPPTPGITPESNREQSFSRARLFAAPQTPVSYTHLTLPTIYSV